MKNGKIYSFLEELKRIENAYYTKQLLEKCSKKRSLGLNYKSEVTLSVSNAKAWKILANGWNLMQQCKSRCTEEALLAGTINRVPLKHMREDAFQKR